MTFSHEDANARLLDLVYGEAVPAEREALEAHVATCARCQQELAALGDTRARLRVALDDQPVPARAHARILAAAAEASNGAAGAATAAPAKGNEPASRAARAAEEPSLWERLRAKWTLPTFATVGAVAVMLLGAKVFFDPQKSLERGREVGSFGQEPQPTEEAAPPRATAPSPNAAPPAEPTGEDPSTVAPRELPPRDERDLSPQARARLESLRRYGAPHGKMNDLLGNKPSFKADKLGGASRALEGLRADAFRRGSGGGVVGGAVGGTAPAAPQELAKKPAKGSVDNPLDGLSSSGSGSRSQYARPPAEWKAEQPSAAAPATAAAPPPPPARAPAPAKKYVDKKTVADDPFEGLGDSQAVSGAGRSADDRLKERELAEEAESSSAKRKAAPAPVAHRAEAKPAPAAPAPSGAKNETEKDASPSYQTLARRADELYAAGRWAEATAAYADLLRRFPTAEPAPRWRARLATAQREAAPPPAAAKPAAKASKAATEPASQ